MKYPMIITFILICSAFLSCASGDGQKAHAALNKSTLCVAVSFEALYSPEDKNGQLCVIQLKNRKNLTIPDSLWLLQHELGYTEIIGSSLSSNFTRGVYALKISQNQRYLALETASEGAMWVEVIDLRELIARKKFKSLKEITTHPGYVKLLRWENNQLLLESDRDLLAKNKALPSAKSFAYNPADKSLREK